MNCSRLEVVWLFWLEDDKYYGIVCDFTQKVRHNSKKE